LGVFALLVGAYVCKWHFASSITAYDLDRIQMGMTLDEVTAILRTPPDQKGFRSVWEGEGGDVVLFFDDRGHAYSKHFEQVSGISRLRRAWLRKFGTVAPF
jgi:hypothetical protein